MGCKAFQNLVGTLREKVSGTANQGNEDQHVARRTLVQISVYSTTLKIPAFEHEHYASGDDRQYKCPPRNDPGQCSVGNSKDI